MNFISIATFHIEYDELDTMEIQLYKKFEWFNWRRTGVVLLQAIELAEAGNKCVVTRENGDRNEGEL